MLSVGNKGDQISIMDSGIDVGMGAFSSLDNETVPPDYNYDPLLPMQGSNSPIEFKVEPDFDASIDFTSPAKMYMDTLNSNITPFMDAVPDTMLESLNSSILCSPFSLPGDENPLEVFQDFRHTSTPKQVILKQDRVHCLQSRKRIKFSMGGPARQSRSLHVLHDITSNNVLPRQSDSFVKISDSFTGCQVKTIPIEVPETCRPTPEKPLIHKLPILRGNSRRKPDFSSVSCVESARQSSVKDFLNPVKDPSVRERDMWLYYTGFTNYELMFKVLSHLSVPSEEGLSSCQILIMTLMRLKCNLDWKDLSHRFHLFEPIAYSLFHSTLSLLSYSLSDVIPWTLPPCERSNMNITVLIYPLSFRCNDSVMNIYVFVTDSRCPVLYVSNPLLSTQKPFSLLPLLSPYFNTDDQICIKGLSLKNHPTFFRIIKTPKNELVYKYVEAKNSLSKTKFIRSCEDTVRTMKQYKLILSKVPGSDESMKQIVSVVSSLINIRTSHHIGDQALKNIYKRCYEAPRTSRC